MRSDVPAAATASAEMRRRVGAGTRNCVGGEMSATATEMRAATTDARATEVCTATTTAEMGTATTTAEMGTATATAEMGTATTTATVWTTTAATAAAGSRLSRGCRQAKRKADHSRARRNFPHD
jgi:hypothetical protein